MGEVTCNPLSRADASLQLSEVNCLYDRMKYVVYLVIITVGANRRRVERLATGVAVDKQGYIITSSFRLDKSTMIQVRNFESDELYNAEVALDGNGDGLALLKIRKWCDFAKIGDETSLIPGRDVFGISHPSTLKFTFLTGKLVSRLKMKKEIGIQIDGLDRFFQVKLGADMKLLHISGFESHGDDEESLSSLGAPIFNSNGHVIGVIVASDRGFDYAAPASYLHQILGTIKGGKSSVTQTGESSSGEVGGSSGCLSSRDW